MSKSGFEGGIFHQKTMYRKDGTKIIVTSNKGKIQIDINGHIKTYLGKNGEIGELGEVIIDGRPVTPNDDRLVAGVTILSSVSDETKSKMEKMAADSNQTVEIDALGNVSFSFKR